VHVRCAQGGGVLNLVNFGGGHLVNRIEGWPWT